MDTNIRSCKRKHKSPYAASAAAGFILLAAYFAAFLLEPVFGLRADATGGGYTLLSSETKAVLSGLDEDVYLYYTGAGGNQDLVLAALLKNYAAASPFVHYSILDPASDKQAIEKFSGETPVSAGSVIVSDTSALSGEAPKRFDVLGAAELYSDSRFGPGFSGESKITPALSFVAAGTRLRAVFLTGEGEQTPCEPLLRDIDALYFKSGYASAGEPLDPASDTLIIISPVSDLSKSGYANISAFLDAGGRAMFFISSVIYNPSSDGVAFAGSLDNFYSLLSAYGLRVGKDVVVGGNPSRTYMSPANIIPYVTDEGSEIETTAMCPILSYAGSLTLSKAPGVVSSPVLITDSACYLKTVDSTFKSLVRSAGDTSGSFVTGATAERGSSRIAVFTSSSFIISAANYRYEGNSGLFTGTLDYLNESPSTHSMHWHAVSYPDKAAIDMPVPVRIFLILIAVAVLPGCAVIAGLSVWAKRRFQ